VAASTIKGITIEIGGDTTKLDKALSGVNKQSRDLQKELKEVEKGLKLDPKNTELLAQKQTLLKEAVAATSEKLDVLKSAEAQVQKQFENGEVSEEQYRALQREIIKTEADLKNLKTAAADSNATLEKIAEVTEKVGNKSADLGNKMLPVTAAITGATAATGKMAMEFEDAMAKLSTITDTTEKPLGELQTEITDLSDQTGISATEIANNVYDAISAGQKTGDAVSFVSNATKLAKAGFTDSASSLDILTTAMNAYEMSADEVTKVSDLLIQTQNLGKTTVGQLSSSMGKVIPTAKANNVAIDQLCAGYSILTAKGIATAESTTYMNSMLNELGKGGTTADKVLREKTGKSFSELSAEGKTVGDVLQILKDYADETNVTFTDLWSSSEAGKAGLVLLGNGADDFNNRLEEMNNSTGATDAAFDKLDTNSNKIKISLNQLKNTATELGETVMEMAAPVIERLSEKVKAFSQWFKNLNDTQKETIVKIGAVVAAIGPALIIFGKLSSGVSKAIGAFSKISGVFKAAGTAGKGLWAILSANPIGAVVAAVVALVAGFVLMYKKCDWFREMVDKAFAEIKKSVSETIEKIKPILQQLGESFKNLMEKLKPVFQFFTTYVMAVIQGALSAVAPIISAVKNAIDFVSNIISAFMALFRGDLDGFSQYIEAALKNLIEIVKNLITAVVNYIITFFQTFGVDVKKIFSDIWSGIVSIFSGVGAWFADKFRAAYTAITTIFSGIGQWFAARWTDIKNALSTVATWFQTMFQNAYTNVKNVFSTIGQWFNDRYTDIKSVFSTVGSWFYTKFTEAYTNIKNVFSNIGSFFSGIWDTIKGIFTNVGTNIGEAIGGAFKSAMNNALATVERAVNKAIGFINGAIDVINDIPGVSIGHVGEVSLPRLAKGGVLKNGQAIMAEAGPELIQMVNGEAVVTPLTASARNTALETAEGGGKSFVQNVNITSPKALSPYETARQTRNATRNMVLQLQGG
jgi:TP901 family phage tail tape measure protein